METPSTCLELPVGAGASRTGSLPKPRKPFCVLFLWGIICKVLIQSPHSDRCKLRSQKAEIPFQPFGWFEEYEVNLMNE